MRKLFRDLLVKEMETNKDIFFITADLGYKLWDEIREKFPDRFVNTGASEFSAVGMAVGLAKMGKIPFVYSITPFLIYRAFEMIRNYVDYERIPVILVGGGRDDDYHIDGFSHDATDVKKMFIHFDSLHEDGSYYIEDDVFTNINNYWPETTEEIPALVKKIIKDRKPTFISLKK